MQLLLETPDIHTPLGSRDRAILEPFMRTGLRVSELVGMNIKDIDMGQELIRVMGKGSIKSASDPWEGRLKKPFGAILNSVILCWKKTRKNARQCF
jgi:site-specific recombinase XerC